MCSLGQDNQKWSGLALVDKYLKSWAYGYKWMKSGIICIGIQIYSVALAVQPKKSA